MAFCTSLCEEGSWRDSSLLFQSEGSISGLDGRNKVWDNSNQTLALTVFVL